MGTRAALRVLPHIARRGAIDVDMEEKLYLTAFRFIFIEWGIRQGHVQHPKRITPDVRQRIIEEISIRDVGVGRSILALYAEPVEAIAIAAKAASDWAGTDVVHTPHLSDVRGVGVTAAAAGSVIWMETSLDADLILEATDNDPFADSNIISHELWHLGEPLWARRSRIAFEDRLDQLGSHFKPWIDWYNRRVAGSRHITRMGALEDERLLIGISEEAEDFWTRRSKEVNEDVSAWLREVAAGGEEGGGTREKDEVLRVAAEMASPDVVLRLGKLDVAPNAKLDRPASKTDFDHSRTDMLGILRAIRPSLGANTPPVVGASLESYQAELGRNTGTLSIELLQILASAVDREFQALEPEMWGEGLKYLIEKFLSIHRSLVSNFPEYFRREEFLADTPVDESSAVGTRLSAPVKRASRALEELSESGLTTREFDDYVLEHLRQSEDLAASPSGSRSSVDEITPKRRHILGSIGFYERVLMALGAIATISAAPVITSTMSAISEAITSLLKLIL